MNPFEKYKSYSQSQFEYWYQQNQEEKTNKCEIKFLEILKELNGLYEQHKQELFQRCFRDTCLATSVS